MILDTGSQQSYATNEVKETLRLTHSCRQLLSVMTFGSKNCERRACEVVKIHMATRDGAGQEMELFVVPSICQPLMSQPIDMCTANYLHLSDLDLADTSNAETTLGIDLLISLDSYWSFATGKVCRGEAGPIAISTQLEWVLPKL